MTQTYEALFQVPAMTLCTIDTAGGPCAAPVYFVAQGQSLNQGIPGWRLYFFSGPDSQHTQNIARVAHAAAAIYPECQGLQDIRGLQLRGAVQAVAQGPEWELAWRAYCAKFPFVGELKPIVARNALYAFVPEWVRLVDNRRSFGFKQEWTFA
jgi:uncharacterized protein YhbP (UPF0306 family)